MGVVLYATIPNVEDAHKAAKKAGLKILQPPKEEYWGDRVCIVVDPFGYQWNFAQHVRDVPPDEIARAATAEAMKG